MPVITGPSAPSLSTILSAANQSASASRVVLPACEGQLQLAFAPDRFTFVPRGLVNTDFLPRIGTVNPAPAPALPLTGPPSQVPMPARVGSAISLETVAGSAAIVAASLALEWLDRQAHSIGDDLTMARTCEIDCDHAKAILGAVELLPLPAIEAETQTQALPAAKGKRRAVLTDEEQKSADSGRRWRLHGYSRKQDNKPSGTGAPAQTPASNQTHACVSTRKVSQAIHQSLYAAAVDLTASIGAMHGNGGLVDGQAWVYDSATGSTVRAGVDHATMGFPVEQQWQAPDETYWASRWVPNFPDAPPDNTNSGSPQDAPGWVTNIQGRVKLITLEAVRKVIDVVCDQFAERIDRVLSTDRTYRAFNVRAMVASRVNALRWKIESRLIEECFGTYRVRTRTGPQIVSTRRDLSGVPYNTWFRFSGYDAFRAAPGRPALPAAEWERRYRARLALRNKTGRTRRGSKGVKVPATKHGRPHKVRDLSP